MDIQTIYNLILPNVGLPLVLGLRHLLLSRQCYGSLAYLNKKANQGNITYNDTFPPLSVVIPAHNQADQLSRYLPLILEQDYPLFEVIVVNDSSTDHTEEVLKELSMKYNHLYHTFTLPTARYVSHRKLSLTLGVKAAKYDWIVTTKADCQPVSNQWLQKLARNFTPAATMVLGYANYEKESGLFNRNIMFDRLLSNLRFMSCVIYNDKAYNGDGCNMAFRKELFIANKGYQKNLILKRGEDSLLVNEAATSGQTRVECSPESVVRQDTPFTHKIWRTDKVFYMETRRHFNTGSKWVCYLHGMGSLINYLSYLAVIGYTALGIYNQSYIFIGIAALALILLLTDSIYGLHKSTKSIGERHFYLYLIWSELVHPIQTLRFKIQRKFTPKKEFLRK